MKLEDAIHLTHGDAAAMTLLGLGAKKVKVRRDLLTVGPCDVDPVRHRTLRHEFWNYGEPQTPSGLPGVDPDEDLKREVAGGPVVIWASRAWSDLTYLWSLVDALVRIGVDRPYLVRPSAEDPTMPMGGIAPERVRAAFDDVAPLTDDVGRSCLAFWNAYATAEPLGFDELRRRGAAVVPEMGRILEGHGAWFPWREGDAVRVADADADILRGQAAYVMRWIGDGCLAQRRAAWHGLGIDSADQVQRVSSVASFPPLWVGGCRVNDPASPWVRVLDGGGWRIERM
jgi:hypothetical protein